MYVVRHGIADKLRNQVDAVGRPDVGLVRIVRHGRRKRMFLRERDARAAGPRAAQVGVGVTARYFRRQFDRIVRGKVRQPGGFNGHPRRAAQPPGARAV